MTTTHGRTPRNAPASHEPAARPAPVAYVWAIARLALGWVFLWAFLDKAFGLGHDTPAAQAWINGGSPTKGFLAHGAAGPLAGFYHGIAGAAWADWLFMLGLLGIGLALILGIGMRIAAATGAVLLVMMYAVVLPPDNNVFMDDHLIYALLIIGLALVGAGDTLGLGRWWKNTTLVQNNPILR